VALDAYGVGDARLTPLRHEHNTTFRVDVAGERLVLRIDRPGVHTTATVGSEAAWLAALRRDTDLAVPSPVAARGGRLVVEAAAPGVPERRVCILVRWLDGRFVNRRLTRAHLGEVGATIAALQDHAIGWTLPAGFVRPRVDTLTTTGKRDSLAPSAEAARSGDHPSREDGRALVDLVGDLLSTRHGDLAGATLESIRATTRDLASEAGSFGLIHGDLHQENYLFAGRNMRAIDFDDCGWGFHLYDLMVTTVELERHPGYPALRAAALEAYAERRPLPARYEEHLIMLVALRRLQLVAWILESREHAAFRHVWQEWAQEELDELAALMDGGPKDRAS
jgi:Ser/Thr protein kinase RdoA (MazF antagonist)